MATSPREQEILGYIGANVRRLRVAHGWTQQELAEATGLKGRYVQLLETGTANPTVKVLIAVSIALDVPAADLFAEAKPEPRPAGNPRLQR